MAVHSDGLKIDAVFYTSVLSPNVVVVESLSDIFPIPIEGRSTDRSFVKTLPDCLAMSFPI